MPNKYTANPHSDEQYIVRHRNPLAGDYVVVSRVVLIGYPQLSDSAKLTYWVIYSHDWYERDGKGRKGYAYPTIARLASLRRATPRTIQRHLRELIHVGLLTRELRAGRPSLLFIEEPSKPEIDRYLANRSEGGDKNVGGGATRMSPHKEEEIKQEKSINAVENLVMEEGSEKSPGWHSIGGLLNQKQLPREVRDRQHWVADEIAARTGDQRSLGCYRIIASKCPASLIFEALSLLKETQRDGRVRASHGALFVATVRRLCRERGLLDPVGPNSKPSQPPGWQHPVELRDYQATEAYGD